MKSFIEFINEGAWGYLPIDSDSALDFRGNILKSIFKQINNEFEKSFNETNMFHKGCIQWDCIGNCMFFLDSIYSKFKNGYKLNSDNVESKCIEYCKQSLVELKLNNEWLESWRDSDKALNTVNKVEKQLTKLINTISK